MVDVKLGRDMRKLILYLLYCRFKYRVQHGVIKKSKNMFSDERSKSLDFFVIILTTDLT